MKSEVLGGDSFGFLFFIFFFFGGGGGGVRRVFRFSRVFSRV